MCEIQVPRPLRGLMHGCPSLSTMSSSLSSSFLALSATRLPPPKHQRAHTTSPLPRRASKLPAAQPHGAPSSSSGSKSGTKHPRRPSPSPACHRGRQTSPSCARSASTTPRTCHRSRLTASTCSRVIVRLENADAIEIEGGGRRVVAALVRPKVSVDSETDVIDVLLAFIQRPPGMNDGCRICMRRGDGRLGSPTNLRQLAL
jgi:hypothetical protein